MTRSPMTFADLVERGTAEIEHYRGRAQPPTTALEWLGIAVSQLPELATRARTVDELSGRARHASSELRKDLLEGLACELAAAAATVEQARRIVLGRHPARDGEGSPEDYCELVEPGQRHAVRRSDVLIGAHASFLGGAIEAAGALADAEVATARGRRWDRGEHERLVQLRAAQLCSALTNALGGLLAYSRLLDEDMAGLRG